MYTRCAYSGIHCCQGSTVSATYTYTIGMKVTLKIGWDWGRGTTVKEAGLAFFGDLTGDIRSDASYSGTGSDSGTSSYPEVSVTSGS